MSLLELVAEVATAMLEALDSAIAALEEDDEGDWNPPPLSAHDKAARTWPTEDRRERRPGWPPFLGHPVPIGGDAA
ncbi:hypothetical protein [Halorarum salinum]|uniref:Uncharacterized protein n=1 Tax=Halorarum salinum TaxID=2743089 RepID=A0A7D5LAZ5_9EURY|nr:hypothetical protein [Halobaculum salinum]QLG62194.1 hypothetical protein HUG12_10805 [Halobaculum salinum]